jgi:hypothetical protein
VKVLYLLYSCKKNKKKATACLSTWAKKCENAVVVTDEPMFARQAEMLVDSRGYEKLCEKTCLMWEQAWERFGKEFDYFVKVDDDTYVFPENLERKLASDRPQFFGNYSRWRSPDPSIIKWVTGSFYGVSNPTLHKMVGELGQTIPRNQFLARGAEDVAVSVLLAELGIVPIEWDGIYISERKKTLKTLFERPAEIISVTNLTPIEIRIIDSAQKCLLSRLISFCRKAAQA